MLRPKQNLDGFVPVAHGGINYAELAQTGIRPDDIIDFSVCTNPFGPPPGIGEAISRAVIGRYPDSESRELKRVLAEKLDINADNLIIGSGSTELIRLVATAFFGLADVVVVPTPTYGDYETACHLVGARVIDQPLNEEGGFRPDIDGSIGLICGHKAKGIFLCNPNNPTGRYLPLKDIETIISAAPDCLLVLDEAYIAFTADTWSSIDLIGRDNLIVLRSMTKDYALAGLRLGYAMASTRVISILSRIKPSWNVSSVAQAAGIYALQSGDYLKDSRQKIGEAKKFLMDGLSRMGFSILPSHANFFLVKVKDAAGLRQALLRKGFLVRDCTSFGLPCYIRVAPRSIADCRKLLAAIKEPEVVCYVR